MGHEEETADAATPATERSLNCDHVNTRLSGWSALRIVTVDWGRLSSACRLTLAALFRFTNSDGIAWPSDRTLGRHSGLSSRTTRLARHDLRELGLMRWVNRPGVTNIYHLDFAALTALLEPNRGNNNRGNNNRGCDDGGKEIPTPRQWLPNTAAVAADEQAEEQADGTGCNSSRTPEGAGGAESPKSKSREKSCEPNTTSPKKLLLDHYHDEFVRCQGERPVITGAKDTRILAQLLGSRPLDDAKRIVTEFLESPPNWYAERGLFEPEHIVSAANQILSRRRPAPSGGASGEFDRAADSKLERALAARKGSP